MYCFAQTLNRIFFFFFVGTSAPECYNYKTIDDSTRKINHKSGKYNYDNYLATGWYSFVTGYQMPSRSSSSSGSYCYSAGHCDTYYHGVLIGSHPSGNQVASRMVCFGYSGNCCYKYQYISVRSCQGSFFVYHLRKTCSSCRYCTRYWLCKQTKSIANCSGGGGCVNGSRRSGSSSLLRSRSIGPESRKLPAPKPWGGQLV